MKTLFPPSSNKRTSILLYLSFIAIGLFVGCQKDNVVPQESSTFPTPDFVKLGNSCYDVTLVGNAPVNNGDGTYTWTWCIINTNPGNGKNNTCQNLSHWNFVPSTCIFSDDIVSAAYAYGNNPFTTIFPTPVIQIDPSQSCSAGIPVFKFDYGTSGSQPTYYQLTVNKNFAVNNNAVAYWKAGQNCGSGTFPGIGCFNQGQNCSGQTGFGGNTPGGGNAWWYYFDTAAGGCQDIYAGQQKMVGGSVCYNAATDVLTITLGPNWSLQSVPESVKVQGYTTPPASRPPAGQFTTYKGTSLTVHGNGSPYYVIHLDVQYCN